MSRRKPRTVVPCCNDRYYVYALFKPQDAHPFYVGKGKGSRINDHFKKSNLKVNNPKTGIIKKYGGSIRREILCYFDKEESAYEFEEYLIDLYGFKSEGGYLVNYAKTRFQFSDQFVEHLSSKGHLEKKTKYSDETVILAYKMYFENVIPVQEVSEKTGIPPRHLRCILRGARREGLFSKYITGGEIKDNRRGREHQRKLPKKYPDEVLRQAFEEACSGIKTVSELSRELGCAEGWLGQVFLGKYRQGLNLDSERYRGLSKGTRGQTIRDYKRFLEYYPEIDSIPEISKLTGISRTSCYRYRDKFKAGNTSSLGSGNGANSGDTGDTSVSDNKDEHMQGGLKNGSHSIQTTE